MNIGDRFNFPLGLRNKATVTRNRVTRVATLEGYVRGSMYFLREGVIDYDDYEFGLSTSTGVVSILYSRNAISDNTFLLTARDKPIISGYHTTVGTSNYSWTSSGHLSGVVTTEIANDIMYAKSDYILNSEEAIISLGDSEQEVSAQLNSVLTYLPGVYTYPGGEKKEYDFVIGDMTLNHVSLVDRGRFGADVKLLNTNFNNSEVMKMGDTTDGMVPASSAVAPKVLEPKKDANVGATVSNASTPDESDVALQVRLTKLENSITKIGEALNSLISNNVSPGVGVSAPIHPGNNPSLQPAGMAPAGMAPTVQPLQNGTSLTDATSALRAQNEVMSERLQELESSGGEARIKAAVAALSNAKMKASSIFDADYSMLLTPIDVMRTCLCHKYPTKGFATQDDAYVRAYFDSVRVENVQATHELAPVVSRQAQLENAALVAYQRRLDAGKGLAKAV